jgi:heme exporter protein D
MAFDTFTDFLTMGKHGAYVWSVYGFSFLALLILIWNTLSKRNKVRKTLRSRFLRD